MSKLFKVKDPHHFGDCVVGQFDDVRDAIKCAEEILNEYRKYSYDDGEWPERTEEIRVIQGEKVVARAVECNVIERPDDLDEDGYSPSQGLYFDSVDRYCDYRIVRVDSAHQTGGGE